jgi:hypothetical protein
VKIRDMGLRPLDLGDRVFFTHRATSVSDIGEGHTRYSGIGRDLGRADWHRQFQEKPGAYAEDYEHPSCGWPAPFRPGARWREGATSPIRMTRWVVVWPERGTGRVVGLTYRAEGRVREYGRDEPNEWDEFERYPLYEIRAHLNGAKVLVPPFACVPLDEHVVTFGDNIPLVFGLDGVPERTADLDWDDYVEHRLATDLGVRENVAA